MTDFTTRTPEEAKVLELLQISYVNHTSCEVALRQVFTAMWYASLTTIRVKTVAEAISNTTFKPGVVQHTLNTMVDEGVLRTVRHMDATHYEVAL